jgi:hypothetical protein
MAGLRGAARCHDLRLTAVEHLALRRPLPARVALHAAGCARCAAELQDVGQVLRTFRAAGFGERAVPARPADGRPDAELGERVMSGVLAARTARRRMVAAGAVAVVAGCAGLGLLVAHTGERARQARPVALVPDGPAAARGWGSGVPVSVSGLAPGRTYALRAVDGTGRSVPAGSVCGPPGGAVRVVLVAAMPARSVAEVEVLDGGGRRVAEAAMAPAGPSGVAAGREGRPPVR